MFVRAGAANFGRPVGAPHTVKKWIQLLAFTNEFGLVRFCYPLANRTNPLRRLLSSATFGGVRSSMLASEPERTNESSASHPAPCRDSRVRAVTRASVGR
jgi:hypothetical protein